MSLTILFQLPVDTGTAKIRPKVENANLKDFYLLTGKINSGWAEVATLRSTFELRSFYSFQVHDHRFSFFYHFHDQFGVADFNHFKFPWV